MQQQPSEIILIILDKLSPIDALMLLVTCQDLYALRPIYVEHIRSNPSDDIKSRLIMDTYDCLVHDLTYYDHFQIQHNYRIGNVFALSRHHLNTSLLARYGHSRLISHSTSNVSASDIKSCITIMLEYGHDLDAMQLCKMTSNQDVDLKMLKLCVNNSYRDAFEYFLNIHLSKPHTYRERYIIDIFKCRLGLMDLKMLPRKVMLSATCFEGYCYDGNIEIVKYLIDLGHNNICRGLRAAVKMNRYEIVDWIGKLGTRLTACIDVANTPTMIDLILSYTKTERHLNKWHAAIRSGYIDLLKSIPFNSFMLASEWKYIFNHQQVLDYVLDNIIMKIDDLYNACSEAVDRNDAQTLLKIITKFTSPHSRPRHKLNTYLTKYAIRTHQFGLLKIFYVCLPEHDLLDGGHAPDIFAINYILDNHSYLEHCMRDDIL